MLSNPFSVEICEDIVQILQESETPNPAFRLWITTEVNKVKFGWTDSLIYLID